ncbi:HTTM domain-containing protein [Kitasatospora sp. NPDC089913]|uniref:HTTM domain-containing protein n=1 Tax=Kitasatospora sp. NPDC089913 TaxID=3364080 RepID=UPI00380BD3D9
MNTPRPTAGLRRSTHRALERAGTLLDDLSLHRRALIGTALARILLGSLGTYLYLRDYTARGHFWGPDAVWTWHNLTAGDGFSLYALSRSQTWFELLFHTGALAAVLFTLGWKTRFTGLAHYVLLWSLHQRNPVLLDGGDNVTAIALFYFLAIDSGARFSLDARARSTRAARAGTPPTGTLRHRTGSLLHNAGVLAVVLQVCTVYLVSGLYKVQGERWQNGTALYYVLRVSEFGWPGVNRHLYEHATLVVAVTYATVFFQIAFAFLLIGRRTRPFAVAGGILMHLGIAVHMAGLITFSLAMIALELVIMGDDHYRRLARFCGLPRSVPPEPPEPPPGPRTPAPRTPVEGAGAPDAVRPSTAGTP